MFTEAPAATAPKGSQEHAGGHYYELLPSGVWAPLYAEGGTFTLRDARKLRKEGRIVCPSVTSIFKVLHKESLQDWIKEQVALAAWEQPADHGFHNKTEWIDQTIARADSVSGGAMTLGTNIHKGVEEAIAGKPYDASVAVYVEAVMEARESSGVKTIAVEKCVGNADIGYAGRCDEIATDDNFNSVICDVKSRKSKGGKVATYATDAAQVAAYGYAEWGESFLSEGRGLIFGVSTTEPGVVTVHEYGPKELTAAFQAFVGMVSIWNWEKKW